MPDPADSAAVDLRATTAWIEGIPRGTVRASGAGASAFVEKFTTAAIADMRPGAGREGFFADARGWVLALATLLRQDDGLLIDCDAATAETLRAHLEHYHIREDVSFTDETPGVDCFLVAGPDAASLLAAASVGELPSQALGHSRIDIGGVAAHVVAIDWLHVAGFLVRVPRDQANVIGVAFAAAGLPQAPHAAFETLRIESRFPLACDIPAKMLPQELDRASRAISFTKGCYLGQETVARIDALGHVNRTLALVAIAGERQPGTDVAVTRNGEVVGTLTSTTLSPRLGPCGIGILNRRAFEPTAVLEVDGHRVRLVAAGSASRPG
ncbi:MAG: YgfZ/GcvT domain-containing protein [Planctomycetaceae bacterium]